MKKIIYITAFALITVFTAVSCVPELQVAEYDFTAANERHKPEKTTGVGLPAVTAGIAAAENPQIDIWFPKEADIHKNFSLSALNKFLTFHNYSSPLDLEFQSKGMTSILSAAIPYKLINRFGNTITVELEKNYLTQIAGYSNLIAKFNGQTYTFSDGLKMDVDLNGTGGEAVYDDLYIEINLYGSTPDTWVSPGHKKWFLQLLTPSVSLTWDNPDVSEPQTFNAAYLDLGGISAINDSGMAVYKAVADLFAKNVKLQKFSNQRWIDTAAAVYDADYVSFLIFKDVKFEHNTPYRVRWTGGANLKTSGKYFDAQQRLYVSGEKPVSSSNKARYNWTESVSDFLRPFNYSTGYYEISDLKTTNIPFPVTAFPQGIDGKDVVLKVNFEIRGDGISEPHAGLSEMSLNDFTKSFKVVYRVNNYINNFKTDNNIIYVGIKKVQFAAEGIDPESITDAPNTTYKNVIYITLDSSYRYTSGTYRLYFLINDGLKYTGTPVSAFGSLDNFLFNRFRQYNTYLTFP